MVAHKGTHESLVMNWPKSSKTGKCTIHKKKQIHGVKKLSYSFSESSKTISNKENISKDPCHPSSKERNNDSSINHKDQNIKKVQFASVATVYYVPKISKEVWHQVWYSPREYLAFEKDRRTALTDAMMMIQYNKEHHHTPKISLIETDQFTVVGLEKYLFHPSSFKLSDLTRYQHYKKHQGMIDEDNHIINPLYEYANQRKYKMMRHTYNVLAYQDYERHCRDFSLQQQLLYGYNYNCNNDYKNIVYDYLYNDNHVSTTTWDNLYYPAMVYDNENSEQTDNNGFVVNYGDKPFTTAAA